MSWDGFEPSTYWFSINRIYRWAIRTSNWSTLYFGRILVSPRSITSLSQENTKRRGPRKGIEMGGNYVATRSGGETKRGALWFTLYSNVNCLKSSNFNDSTLIWGPKNLIGGLHPPIAALGCHWMPLDTFSNNWVLRAPDRILKISN